VYKTFLKVSIKKKYFMGIRYLSGKKGKKSKNSTKFKNTKTIGGIGLNFEKNIYYTHEIMYKLEMIE